MPRIPNAKGVCKEDLFAAKILEGKSNLLILFFHDKLSKRTCTALMKNHHARIVFKKVVSTVEHTQ